jgi:hypothetical protein
MPDKGKKCKHPSCVCNAREGSDYCSAYCEGQGTTPDLECQCGHPDCSTRPASS